MVATLAVLILTSIPIYWTSTENMAKYVKKHDMVLVEFWGTWCPECTKNFQKTLDTAKAYPKAKFLMIAVSDNEYDLRRYVKGKKIPKNVLITTWRGRTPVKYVPQFWAYYKGNRILKANTLDEVKQKLITDFGEEVRKALK